MIPWSPWLKPAPRQGDVYHSILAGIFFCLLLIAVYGLKFYSLAEHSRSPPDFPLYLSLTPLAEFYSSSSPDIPLGDYDSNAVPP